MLNLLFEYMYDLTIFGHLFLSSFVLLRGYGEGEEISATTFIFAFSCIFSTTSIPYLFYIICLHL